MSEIAYKLNNSYTVYVNSVFYNEVRRIHRKINHQNASVRIDRQYDQGMIDRMIPSGKKVFSDHYGEGTVKELNERGIITVVFDGQEHRYIFSEALRKSFFRFV